MGRGGGGLVRDLGHMTRKASIPDYGKNPSNSYSAEQNGQEPCGFVGTTEKEITSQTDYYLVILSSKPYVQSLKTN